MKKIILIVSILLNINVLYSQELVVYNPPTQMVYSQHNDDFTVRVRKAGGEWQDLFEYNVQVDLDKVQDASMVYFDFSGTVEVSVKKNNGNFQSVKIRPTNEGIKPIIKGGVVTFVLTKPTKLSVEFDGDRLHNLHLFANPLETYKPDPKDTSVIYFGAGYHKPSDLPGNAFRIPSNKTVYIAGGAVVNGKLLCNGVKNVRIIGRGIIDQPERGIEITNSQNIEIEGIIVRNPQHYTVFGGQSKNISIKNLKSFSCKGWSDGLDFMSCSDVNIDGVFMRNSDDCIAIYAHRWTFYGNAKNYKISNSILWADVAHPTNIGGHGNAEGKGDTISNITFSNIDILEQDEDDIYYQGCLSIAAADKNVVQDITYENIRIDNIQEGQILNFRTLFNEKYSAAAGRSIKNVRLKNISCTGDEPNTSVIGAYSKDSPVEGISIENLTINGVSVLDAKSGNIKVGDFVKDLKFKK